MYDYEASRPYCSEQLTGRAATRFYRATSAYDLATRIKETPLESDVRAARDLLDRVTRYALAEGRACEVDNDSSRYDEARSKHTEDLLAKRRARLVAELTAYGATLEDYGVYPSVIDATTHQDLYAIHFYD